MQELDKFTPDVDGAIEYLISCALNNKYISSVYVMTQYKVNRGQFEKCVIEAKKTLQKTIEEYEFNNKKNLDTNINGR